ncbi:MAG TPA: DUF222 domain-containing protein [Candidatus Dormibacteraeota bacterium]
MIAAPDAWYSSAQDLSADELVERLAGQAHAEDMQALSFSMDAALVASSGEWNAQGYSSPIEWIRKDCKMTGGEVADRMCVGMQAGVISASIDAVIAGEIGFAHLVVIARTAEALRESATSKGFDESPLLKRASNEESLTIFNNFCLHYRHAMDPEGYAADELSGIEARKLKLSSNQQGMVHISAWLDPAGAATVRTALEPLARKQGAGDERERARRMADALVEVAARTLDGGSLPTQGTQRPHLQVTTTIETLLGIAGAPAAEMEFSLPISSKTVERLACDCSVTRILLGSDSTVIDVGRAKRVISAPQRKALVARDLHCAWPGCDRHATFSEGHHLLHWIRNGPTILSNLVLLCYWHHVQVHEGGWQIARSDDGRVLVVPPQRKFDAARGPD